MRRELSIPRRLDTPENVAYWDYVDACSREVRGNRYYHMICGPTCKHGDGEQTCDDVVRGVLQELHPDDVLFEAWERMTFAGVKVG